MRISGGLKLWLFLITSLLGGALLGPLLFDAGRTFAELESSNPTRIPGAAYLAEKATSHPYEDFFKRALTVVALILIYPTWRWLKHEKKVGLGQTLQKNQYWRRDWLVGFVLASGWLLSLGFVATAMGWFKFSESIDWMVVAKKTVGPTLGAGIIEELLFRGALLGVLLKSMEQRWRAVLTVSLIYAVAHFIDPPDGMVIDESSVGFTTGLWIIWQMILKVLNPSFFVTEVLTFLLIGLILAYARLKTASLWLPIGLHMGWVFGYMLFKRISSRGDTVNELWLGGTLKDGLLPLLVLGLTWFLVSRYLADRAVNGNTSKRLKERETSEVRRADGIF